MSGTFIVVESYPGYSKHLRLLASGEQPNLTGLTSKPQTLCGKTIDVGWDTKIPLPLSIAEWREDPVWQRNCLDCAKVYRGKAPYAQLQRVQAALLEQEQCIFEEKKTRAGAVDRWFGMASVIDAVRKALRE